MRRRRQTEDYARDIIGERPPFEVGLFAPLAAWPSPIADVRAFTSPTSEAARERNAPRAPSQREVIWNVLRGADSRGMTRPELMAATALPMGSINARISELVATGYAYDTGTGARDDCAIVRYSGTRYDARAITIHLKALKERDL